MILSSEVAKDIVLSEPMHEAMGIFRKFMFKNVYHSEKLTKERAQAVFVLQQLYSYFMEHSDKLPEEFLQRQERWGLQQTVVDYVAGLTDSYAVQLFGDIYIPPVGLMVK